jgi:F0F1-type ATP synthase delta subunit
MTKKQIKQLAQASYTRNTLDSKKVARITKLFSRAELKEYIKNIKALEKSKTLVVLAPKNSIGQSFNAALKKQFPDKQIEFKEDPTLIAGIKVVDNDNVYDFNIKNILENLVSYINQ